MSEVTNLILSFSPDEDAPAREAELNAWLRVERGYDFLATWRADGCFGGGPLEVPLYVGAFNHFDLEALVAFLPTLPWVRPQSVQVIVCGQHDDHWHEVSWTS